MIKTEQSEAVEAVNVQLSGQRSASDLSDVQGLYGFQNLQTGYDYSVTPSKDGDYLNGVSTYDIVLDYQAYPGCAAFDKSISIHRSGCE
ncbi:MAG: hypothetical protein IPJ74_01695 [Saprospiraceae bacterium]|nr:hypothetical protein [Saprospiraceae bacterium]